MLNLQIFIFFLLYIPLKDPIMTRIQTFIAFITEKKKENKKKSGQEPVSQTEADKEATPEDDKETLTRSTNSQRLS
jgi:hypothetical protein